MDHEKSSTNKDDHLLNNNEALKIFFTRYKEAKND